MSDGAVERLVGKLSRSITSMAKARCLSDALCGSGQVSGRERVFSAFLQLALPLL